MMLVTERLKTCSLCQRELPLSEFFTSTKTAGGLYSQCKACSQSRKGRSICPMCSSYTTRESGFCVKCEAEEMRLRELEAAAVRR